jgi:hypothetical protein
MALRVLLVAIVAALGLDLPGAEELSGFARSGREWVAARMADLASLCADEAPAESTTEAPPARVDFAFEAVAEEMASGFSADLALMRSKPPVEEVLPSVEPQSVQESRLERLSTAVRLTKQAVDAWASVVQPTSERVVVEESGDSL